MSLAYLSSHKQNSSVTRNPRHSPLGYQGQNQMEVCVYLQSELSDHKGFMETRTPKTGDQVRNDIREKVVPFSKDSKSGLRQPSRSLLWFVSRQIRFPADGSVESLGYRTWGKDVGHWRQPCKEYNPPLSPEPLLASWFIKTYGCHRPHSYHHKLNHSCLPSYPAMVPASLLSIFCQVICQRDEKK